MLGFFHVFRGKSARSEAYMSDDVPQFVTELESQKCHHFDLARCQTEVGWMVLTSMRYLVGESGLTQKMIRDKLLSIARTLIQVWLTN